MLAPAWDLLTRCMIAARDSPPSYPKNGGRRFLIGGFDMVTWGWTRFACITAPAFHGARRVGEPLRARHGLVLPEEECLQEAVCFVCIRAPKPGCGWWQLLFQELDPSSMLYPSSASTYWRRRDKIADALGIPVGAQLTPGSLRPGGTIHLNHSGLAIADLMWRLRLH